MSQLNWIVVTIVSGELQAELMRGLLEAQEIPVMLMQESAGKAIGITISQLGEVEIMVPKSKIQDARDVIAKYFSGEYEGMEFSEE